MLTIDPPPAATMCRAKTWHAWNTALRLIVRMRSQSASVASRNELPAFTPAELTRMSARPVCLRRFGQQVFDRLARGDVDRAEAGLAAELFERLHAGLAAFFGQIGDDDVGAGLAQARHTAPRPARPPRR